MTTVLIGKALSPFLAVLLAWAVSPARRAIERRMPDGRLKRFLLRRVN